MNKKCVLRGEKPTSVKGGGERERGGEREYETKFIKDYQCGLKVFISILSRGEKMVKGREK